VAVYRINLGHQRDREAGVGLGDGYRSSQARAARAHDHHICLETFHCSPLSVYQIEVSGSFVAHTMPCGLLRCDMAWTSAAPLRHWFVRQIRLQG